MPVTLKELAMRANVHPSTISRVANNDPSLRIAAGTRQRIEELLRETGYQPNGIARGLKLRQTNVLAVVIPDVTNPFFAALFRGVEDAAAPAASTSCSATPTGCRNASDRISRASRAAASTASSSPAASSRIRASASCAGSGAPICAGQPLQRRG